MNTRKIKTRCKRFAQHTLNCLEDVGPLLIATYLCYIIHPVFGGIVFGANLARRKENNHDD